VDAKWMQSGCKSMEHARRNDLPLRHQCHWVANLRNFCHWVANLRDYCHQ
jgi:hypothetical protein